MSLSCEVSPVIQGWGNTRETQSPMIRPALCLLLCLLIAPAWAEPLNEAKPFAEKHVILQISEASPEKQNVVLNIANNLIRHYGGPDRIDIKIVGFAPGVQLFRENGHQAKRIQSLVENGVDFYICENTLESIKRKTGIAFPYMEEVIPVQSGVAYILDEVERGYTLVTP